MPHLESKSTSPRPTAPLAIPTSPAQPEKRTVLSYAGKTMRSIDFRGALAGLKTFLWVAPLTALIWIYAEREQLKPAEVGVQIKLLSKSTDRIITVTSPEDKKVFLDVQGPSASLDELRDALAKGPLDVSVNPDIGYAGDISIAEAITKSDLFKSHAVEVKAARPPVNIKVEAKVARRIPVQARQEDKSLGAPTFEPDSVVIEGPKDVLDDRQNQNLVALANLTVFKNKRPDTYVEEVPIFLSRPLGNITMRETVRAKLTIANSETANLSAIPIYLQLPALVLQSDKYRITTTPETLQGIEVTGPPDAIAQLRQKKFPAAVVLDLTQTRFSFDTVQTTENWPYTIQAQEYRMPDGVTVVSPAKDITITVTRRGN
jgi:hypothetical protein